MRGMTVMVTGAGGGGHGEQIYKALKMSKLNYRIIAADMSAFSVGLYGADKAYILPPATDNSYTSKLLEICKKENVMALFHGSEAELKRFSQDRKAINDAGVFLPINPKAVIDICMDKQKTAKWLNQNGFYCPAAYNIKCIDDVENINIFPLVLKPSIGGGGSVNTFIAQSKNELKMFTAYMLSIYNEFIIQQYVGDYNNEYTVGVLFDMDGSYINSIAVKKNILSGMSSRLKVKDIKTGELLVISSGISQGQIGRMSEVTTQCVEIAKKLGCRGAVNIQCRLDNGKCYVFEINPRFSGTTSLRALVGYNEPDILIRKHLLNEEIEVNFAYKEGHIMRGLSEHFESNEAVKSMEAIL